jgi:hypothetical protein
MTETWWLKFDRAQEHLRDLKDEIGRYTDSHPYVAERIPPSKKDQGIWQYVLRVTEQPNPRIAILTGDVVHNLRTSLDHLYVALTGDKGRDFPIYDKDPWERGADGRLLPNRLEDRERFMASIKRAKPRAKTIIKELQPYRVGPKWYNHSLSTIRRLDNADKHRNLIPTTAGVLEGVSIVSRRSQVIHTFYWEYTEDGAVVAKFGWEPGHEPPESEMHVHVRGTPCISTTVPEHKEFSVGIVAILDYAIARFPDDVYIPLERWVIRP